ncbi:MAG: hypothetical protein KDB27_30670 [Planctomycetales bacterium]|nr:hypothetical protein [Planctomycetales bacterium]
MPGRIRIVITVTLVVCCPSSLWGETVVLDNLTLITPTIDQNRFGVTLDANEYGTASAETTLTGSLMAEISVSQVPNGLPLVESITFNGGVFEVSNMTFILDDDIVVQTTGLGGIVASTAPATVTGGEFDASRQRLTLDRGTISSESLGDPIDLTRDPLMATGVEMGMVHLVEHSSDGNSITYNVEVTIPVVIEDTIDVSEDIMAQIDSDGRLVAGAFFSLVSSFRPWHNAALALDVNADGSISPIDALLIINELNDPVIRDSEFGPLPNPPQAPLTPPPFVDVSGDNFVAPNDALLVINHLNGARTVTRAVPEPQSLVFLHCFVTWILIFLRRKRHR